MPATWTTPRTWTAGELVTASIGNSAWRDNFMYLKDSPTFDGTPTVTGNLTLTASLISNGTTDSTSTLTGAIQTDGGLGVAKALWVGGLANIAGAVTLQGALVGDATTDSTSITTGAFQTDGGLGVAKALWVGGLANIAGAVTLQSVGGHAVGGAESTTTAFRFTGAYAPAGGATSIGVGIDQTITGVTNQSAAGLLIEETINKGAAGTHAIFAAAYIATLGIGANTATLTEATNLYIAAAPSAGAVNYSLHCVGAALFDGPITGNLTGNVSGTAATVTGATQAAITSAANLATVGTITSGTWSGSFGAVSGANLTSLSAGNLSGTITSATQDLITRLGTIAVDTTIGRSAASSTVSLLVQNTSATAGNARMQIDAQHGGADPYLYWSISGGGADVIFGLDNSDGDSLKLGAGLPGTSTWMTWFTTGGVSIGDNTDPGATNFRVAGTGKFVGSVTIGGNNDTYTVSGIFLNAYDAGGAFIGRTVQIGRNSNAASNAAANLRMETRTGNSFYVWVDNSNDLRIGSTAPVNAQDTSGTVVGTQTSRLATKELLGDPATPQAALDLILGTRVERFRYQNGAYNHSIFTGIIADWSPEFAMDNGNSFNPVSAFGYTVQAFKAIHDRLAALESSK